jgi:hypothetical protein
MNILTSRNRLTNKLLYWDGYKWTTQLEKAREYEPRAAVIELSNVAQQYRLTQIKRVDLEKP